MGTTRNKKILFPAVFAMVLTLAAFSGSASATVYRGFDIPEGAAAFADGVVSYTPGTVPAPVGTDYADPTQALGAPDYTYPDPGGYVSLGNQGVLVLEFTDNTIQGSGSDRVDLVIFEIGRENEPVSVYVSTTGADGSWFFVGDTSIGSTNAVQKTISAANGRLLYTTTGLDIDHYLAAGEQYRFVKLVDMLPHQWTSSELGPTSGADIDAVAGVSSVPLPASILLFATGLSGVALSMRRRCGLSGRA